MRKLLAIEILVVVARNCNGPNLQRNFPHSEPGEETCSRSAVIFGEDVSLVTDREGMGLIHDAHKCGGRACR